MTLTEGIYSARGIGTPKYEQTAKGQLLIRAQIEVTDQHENKHVFEHTFWLTTEKGTVYSLKQLGILGARLNEPEDFSGFGSFYAFARLKISDYDGSLRIDGIYDSDPSESKPVDISAEKSRLKAAIAALKADGTLKKKTPKKPVKDDDEGIPF